MQLPHTHTPRNIPRNEPILKFVYLQGEDRPPVMPVEARDEMGQAGGREGGKEGGEGGGGGGGSRRGTEGEVVCVRGAEVGGGGEREGGGGGEVGGGGGGGSASTITTGAALRQRLNVATDVPQPAVDEQRMLERKRGKKHLLLPFTAAAALALPFLLLL